MAQNQAYTSFGIAQDGYLSFDATSLKQMISQRLRQTNIFTDDIFSGSNISAYNDIIAYLFHILLFYCNQTSSEGMITSATLYENINRIIKLINYNPIGYSTSTLAFEATASSNLPPNIYNIPRYTYLNIYGVNYCFTTDTSFVKSTNEEETLDLFNKNNILYQGTPIEHPLQTAMGEDFEVITLIPNNNNTQDKILVDHFNFSVFVKNVNTGIWSEWTETDNLFIENNISLKYSKRLNENLYYEFTFGNNVTGKKLNAGDQVAIYYIKSDGIDGQVDANSITENNTLKYYNTTQFNEIMSDISTVEFMNTEDLIQLTYENKNKSSSFVSYESVDDIKNNIPKVFSSNNQLLSSENIETYIKRMFKNIVQDCKVVNNTSYLNGHLKYFQDNLKLTTANKDARVLFNQVNFATSCNFNNIYMYLVPSIGALNDDGSFAFVSPAQKQNMINQVSKNNPLTSNIIAMDPMYMAFAIGVGLPNDDIMNDVEFTTQTIDDIISETQLVITKYKDSRKNPELIKSEISDLITDLFNNNTLQQTIQLSTIVNYILSIEGVKNVNTVRNGVSINGINVLYWNPVYNGIDVRSTSNDISLQYFQFPYLYNKDSLINQIIVKTEE